jgi:carboxylesterase
MHSKDSNMTIPTIIPDAKPFLLPGGPTGCLLVHGFTGTPYEMRALGKHLHQQGHTVLGVRLAAHATKPEDMIRARWADWLISVEDGWHLLSGCTDQIIVMGLSMGGILSLLFAAHYPVAGVVAMATPHHLPEDPRLKIIKLLSVLRPFTPKGPHGWYDEEAYSHHVCYPVDPTRAYIELRDLLDVMQKALPDVTAPALLIYSKQDQTVRAEDGHAEQIFKSLGSQDKQTLWIEDCGHVITRDAQRQRVFQAAAEFVNRIFEGRT